MAQQMALTYNLGKLVKGQIHYKENFNKGKHQ